MAKMPHGIPPSPRLFFLFSFRYPLCQGREDRRFLLRRRFGQGGFGGRHEVGNGLIFIHAQMAGVGANKAFVEDAAGKLIEAVFLNGGEETGADLGGHSNLVQRDLALFPLPLQSCPKGFHLAVFPPPQLALAASKM